MSRILAIDFGSKRVGLAVTDPMQIIATPLETVEATKAIAYLTQYITANTVEAIVMGYAVSLDGTATDNSKPTLEFAKKLKIAFPDMPIYSQDERFTSIIANQTMLAAGLGKKARANKATTDRTSAVIILQSFMENRSNGFAAKQFV